MNVKVQAVTYKSIVSVVTSWNLKHLNDMIEYKAMVDVNAYNILLYWWVHSLLKAKSRQRYYLSLTPQPPCSTAGVAALSACPKLQRWSTPPYFGQSGFEMKTESPECWCTAGCSQAGSGSRGRNSPQLRLAGRQQKLSSTWCPLMPAREHWSVLPRILQRITGH